MGTLGGKGLKKQTVPSSPATKCFFFSFVNEFIMPLSNYFNSWLIYIKDGANMDHIWRNW